MRARERARLARSLDRLSKLGLEISEDTRHAVLDLGHDDIDSLAPAGESLVEKYLMGEAELCLHVLVERVERYDGATNFESRYLAIRYKAPASLAPEHIERQRRSDVVTRRWRNMVKGREAADDVDGSVLVPVRQFAQNEQRCL